MEIASTVSSLRVLAQELGDYNKYRRQCTNRLAKARKREGKASGASKRNPKYTPKPITTPVELAEKKELVKVFIFEAERAWAAAQNIYELAIDAGKSTRVDRDHVTSRFVKAAKIGEALRMLVETPESGATERDILEAIAYSATLSGHAAEHQKKKKVALNNFAIAHMIYSVLSIDDKEKFKKLLTLSVEPQLVRTAAVAGLPRTVKVSATAKQTFPKEERADLVKRIEAIDSKAFDIDADEAKVVVVEGEIVIDSITWRSREAPVDNADIKVALTSAKKSERELNTYLTENENLSGKEKASAFDKVLAAWQEAVDVVKKDIDEKKSTKDQNSVEMQNALLLNTYVNYNLIGWRISRNVTMGEGIVESAKAGRKLSGLKEQVALYDAILQSLEQMEELPGVGMDEELSDELSAKKNYFRALKCHSIANSHFLLNKRRNALALQARALELVSETIKTLQSTEGTGESGVRGITITMAQAEDLKARLEKEVTRFRALAEIEKASADRAHLAVTPLPLIQRLDIFPEAEIDLQNIVHIPPKLEAIPVKPIFFDVAWNYISYPGDGEKVSTAKAEASEDPKQSSTKKGGLFGLFGR